MAKCERCRQRGLVCQYQMVSTNSDTCKEVEIAYPGYVKNKVPKDRRWGPTRRAPSAIQRQRPARTWNRPGHGGQARAYIVTKSPIVSTLIHTPGDQPPTYFFPNRVRRNLYKNASPSLRPGHQKYARGEIRTLHKWLQFSSSRHSYLLLTQLLPESPPQNSAIPKVRVASNQTLCPMKTIVLRTPRTYTSHCLLYSNTFRRTVLQSPSLAKPCTARA